MFLTWGQTSVAGQISLLLRARRKFYGRRSCAYSTVELENLFRTVFKYVLPGNPAEEWLWFKHCRRKGIPFRIPAKSRRIILREVRHINLKF